MKKLIILIEVIIIILLLMASRPEAEIQEQKYYVLKTTGYCPCEICCKPWADGVTYTGDKAGRGSIAIDHKGGPLKLGQNVYVEDYGFGICNDIGGSIKGWEADLCFNSHERALEWGVRLKKVYIIEGDK